jgi:hypothetical protein
VLLYKYRGLSNLQFALDIIINGRMFAASFEQLNDPMEGSYNHGPGKLTQKQIDTLYGQKAKYRLLSLSEISNSTLMWSHYSESHGGIVIGVSVIDPKAHVAKVQYVDDLYLELAAPDLVLQRNYRDIAKTILSRKLRPWEYEQEHRVFIKKERSQGQPTFVNVQIMEVIFGINTDNDKKELVRKVAEKFCPDISIRTMRRADLDIRRVPDA